MSLQIQILKDYKDLFPNDTFKDISLKTKIQQTRVFRIFNGAEMKVTELEALEHVIKANQTINSREFISLSQSCLHSLPKSMINELFAQMNFLIKTKTILA